MKSKKRTDKRTKTKEFIKRLVKFKGLSNKIKGKLQFHRKVENNSKNKRIKPFHKKELITESNYLFYETQAIQRKNENQVK